MAWDYDAAHEHLQLTMGEIRKQRARGKSMMGGWFFVIFTPDDRVHAVPPGEFEGQSAVEASARVRAFSRDFKARFAGLVFEAPSPPKTALYALLDGPEGPRGWFAPVKSKFKVGAWEDLPEAEQFGGRIFPLTCRPVEAETT